MELLKPDYYDEFTCIADKCTISCCREWKINIDDETYRNWKTIQPPSEVPGHRSCLQAYTMKKDGSRIMKMTEELAMSAKYLRQVRATVLDELSTTVLSWQRTDCAIW